MKTCEFCQAPIIRSPGEIKSNHARRIDCGAPKCVASHIEKRALVSRTNAKTKRKARVKRKPAFVGKTGILQKFLTGFVGKRK